MTKAATKHGMPVPHFSPPPLHEAATHLWCVPLDAPEFSTSQASHTLSADERERAVRFRFQRDSRRFIAARASLRQLLAIYAQTQPSQVRFRYSPYGKPALSYPETDLRFNVSHSDDRALIAVTHGREVGVDIEKVRGDVGIDELANRFFSPIESEQLGALSTSEKLAAFFRIWTCKEAFLKAQGMGLSLRLDSFDVEVHPSRPARIVATRPDASEARRWSLTTLNLEAGYAGAVAVEGPVPEVLFQTWQGLAHGH
jgi:4'-phosphopantetheinyl transferase